ncbi:MAG TPA: hypothetical protein VGL89_11805 [Candidatus Koribacter sp.]|jgi:heme/copper-type cytochrome/quinol oxidase subunit 4
MNDTPTTPTPAPSQSRSILRGFLISSAISAGIALVGLALLTVGVGLIIIMPFALIQLAWTLPLFFSYRKQGKRGEAKGALISCAVNIVASIACWGIVMDNMSFK